MTPLPNAAQLGTACSSLTIGTSVHRKHLAGRSWFGGAIELNVDLLRERSLRYLFPDISTQAHLEHTVRLVASGRVRLKPTIKHVLSGIESVPLAFDITANKGKYKAINPAQVMMQGTKR